MLLAPLIALAALVAAAPAPLPDPIPEEGILLSRQVSPFIYWRHGTDRRTLMACAGGGPTGTRNGDLIQIGMSYFRYCNPSWSVTGNINQGPTRCMDATLYPGNGVKPHMWQCYNGVWQQQWRYHADGTIRLDGHNLCLDVTDGDPTKPVQMWECFPGNTNQQWDL
ncbi:hypothetical protein CC85DRAFT_282355 [Cutaneotrichosporon oleaginosum]|uniref:Ricin B lectin domain-containing protein n=1 Tax=Cutaneotrichosporon oleaginosum TaxID=879819 RepID=A0A0J0XXB8_9TREE|nr:uncharacterized protein CC85DRAFT_282355 [Cutaneotrichosporon oleaginosum]KLT45727.1 hypothetical protein CC85DRAFT_282355 [Cutaneotrichosporon oleaginosum]